MDFTDDPSTKPDVPYVPTPLVPEGCPPDSDVERIFFQDSLRLRAEGHL